MTSSDKRDTDLTTFLRDVPIVDAHQHFWDLTAGNPYPNLTEPSQQQFRYGDKAKLRRDYMPPDYRRNVAAHNVVATVHVQVGWPGNPLGETAWLAGLRQREGLPSVGLGQAELQEPDVAQVLAGHAREDWMRGVRTKPRQSEDPRDAKRNQPGSMDDPAWRRGFEHLAKHRFVCDVQVPFWYLPEIADLARDYPGTPIAINHSALPSDRSPEGVAAWRRALELVAPLPNVHLKVSGIGVPPGIWPVEENIGIVVTPSASWAGSAACSPATSRSTVCVPPSTRSSLPSRRRWPTVRAPRSLRSSTTMRGRSIGFRKAQRGNYGVISP